jgi:tRNA(adenine34) deaminase
VCFCFGYGMVSLCGFQIYLGCHLCYRVLAVLNDQSNTRLHDDAWMDVALIEAKRAAAAGEVPVGAVIVHGEKLIGSAHNRREALQSPLAHAEILAIEQASRLLGTWRLNECDIYVTLEPCVMCVGAILQARMRRVVFGCLDAKAGAVESLYRLCQDRRLNHRLDAIGGVHQDECVQVLEAFFVQLREKKRVRQTTERWPSPA